MSEKHKPTETQAALILTKNVEIALWRLSEHLQLFITGEEQHYQDKADSVERCIQMVDGQIQCAWLHAGRAIKRLMVLREAEIGRELETLHAKEQTPPEA